MKQHRNFFDHLFPGLHAHTILFILLFLHFRTQFRIAHSRNFFASPHKNIPSLGKSHVLPWHIILTPVKAHVTFNFTCLPSCLYLPLDCVSLVRGQWMIDRSTPVPKRMVSNELKISLSTLPKYFWAGFSFLGTRTPLSSCKFYYFQYLSLKILFLI